MDITQQQYIVALAEAGSVTGAARMLGVSQPAISSWLKTIEEQLGIQLVVRSKKKVILTPAGEIYLEGARRMIEIRSQTYRKIARLTGEGGGQIRITGTPNGGARIFSALFQKFRELYPTVTLQFLESYNSGSIRMVETGEADIGIGSTLSVESDTLEYICTGKRELVLMVPAGFPLSYDASGLKKDEEFPTADLRAFQEVPFIMPGPEMSYYAGAKELFREAGFEPQVIFQSSNVNVIYDMVRNGNGAGILSRKLFSPLDPVSPLFVSAEILPLFRLFLPERAGADGGGNVCGEFYPEFCCRVWRVLTGGTEYGCKAFGIYAGTGTAGQRFRGRRGNPHFPVGFEPEPGPVGKESSHTAVCPGKPETDAHPGRKGVSGRSQADAGGKEGNL